MFFPIKNTHFSTELGMGSPALSLLSLQVPPIPEVPSGDNVGALLGQERLSWVQQEQSRVCLTKTKPAEPPLESEQHFTSLEIIVQRMKEIPHWGCQHSSPLSKYCFSITFAQKTQQIMSVTWKKSQPFKLLGRHLICKAPTGPSICF